MKSKGGIILAIIILVAAGLCAISYFGIGSNKLLSVERIKQGLDLKGGVSITYEADKQAPTSEEMQSAQSLIRERLDRKNYTEAEVAIQGMNRLRIDIPDIDDVETAISEIGQTAQLLFVDEEGNVLITGDMVRNAYKNVVQTGNSGGAAEVVVVLEFDATGAAAFEQATENNIGKALIILLDEEVLSAPMVNEKISGGSAVISGGFTAEGAEDLAALIRAGSLPFKLNILSTSNVGAKLGADSLSTSVTAGAIGFGMVLLFMLVMYRALGLAANLALSIYLGIELVLISAFGITLTLPGIAGIVLSIGMATDANIIIFERVKEELNGGRSLRSALDVGHSRAFPAIFDSNLTTLIATAVLYALGTGPVKGFAQTLALGVVISMFTALVVTKVILKNFVAIGITDARLYCATRSDVKERKNLNVVANRNKYFIASLAVIAVGLATVIFNMAGNRGAFSYDVEFSGGTSLQVDVGQDFNNNDITDIINEVTGQSAPQVQRITGTNQVLVKMMSIDQEMRIQLIDKLQEKYNMPDDNIGFSDVSPTVSSEMRNSAILAVTMSCLAMLIYIGIRFRDFKKGGSAVIALLHDALIVLTAYAILRIPLNTSFIAAILTVLGYSINSTIVIFDRIRENTKIMTRPTPGELVDASVTQTLGRSVYTSLSTLFTVICLYVLGVPIIKDFTLPIIIGIIVGTYSSVFMSGSIWYMLTSRGKESSNA